MLLLVPADPLNPRRPDEHFAPEADAATKLGYGVAVVNHDAAEAHEAGELLRRTVEASEAVYRGWMLRSGDYAWLHDALSGRGVSMRTSPEAYRRAHELPGWYPLFAELTPQSVEVTDSLPLDQALVTLPEGAAVVKDYVKSMKHYWSDAAFVPDVRDLTAAQAVVDRFRELRDDDLVGNVVLRAFEQFEPGEFRTWWVAGRHVATTAHPDTPEKGPPSDLQLGQVAPAVEALSAWFVTVDVARREDGEWRVVEVGDGQVSDRPSSTAPEELLRHLT